MPLLQIFTNTPRSKIPADAGKELCKVIADTLGKPLNLCAVAIIPDQIMFFGGEDVPCAQATLLCIGKLGVEENKKHSKAISEKVKETLGVDPSKMYIQLQDAKTSEIGYKGTTFHDIWG